MDDMLLSDQHIEELAELRRQMLLRFAMKDLGPTHHILGIKITRQLYLGLISPTRLANVYLDN
jgi:hypothetical protein